MYLTIRSMTELDWPIVANIYKQGIETGNATFEKEIPSWDKWNSSHLQKCRLVAILNDSLVAWAALTPVSGRCVYAGVAEVSVYVSNQYKGLKIGTELLEKLINESEIEGIWTLQAGIFPENKASVKIHENLGFRLVGYREKIGKMDGKWRDTVLLERRSNKTGI
jgi:L-amino acid N-acyltransferase YncA